MMEIVIKCQRCGREVVAHTSQKKFCKECARQNALDRSHRQFLERVARMKDGKPKVCKKCGAQIEQSSKGKRIYCESCAKEVATDRNRSYRSTHKDDLIFKYKIHNAMRRAKRQAKKRAMNRVGIHRTSDNVVKTSVDSRTGYTVQWRGQVCGAGGQMHHD